ncbi:MAG: response regulator [Magnetococcus sp. YQC-9]
MPSVSKRFWSAEWAILPGLILIAVAIGWVLDSPALWGAFVLIVGAVFFIGMRVGAQRGQLASEVRLEGTVSNVPVMHPHAAEPPIKHPTPDGHTGERVQELEQSLSQALEESQAKSEFLAIMSHEIRTPMNVVLGMLELLREAPLEYERREQVRLAYGSGKTLLALIDNVLDFSKMEADRLVLDEVEFDLRALVDESALILATLAHTKEIELTPFFPHGMPTVVRGDMNRLRQVFTNLVGNAIKFTPEGGNVELHGGPVGSGSDGRTEYLFEVRDTGPGVAEADRERIFELFERSEQHRMSGFPGTGLGLAISKRLVERMGGEIGVDVNPYAPSGSIFHFTLQLHQQPSDVGKEEPGRDLFKGLRVLGVEIDGLQRLFLEDVFTLFGARFDYVAEAATALSVLRNARQEGHPYDLVVLNQKPGQDGRFAHRYLLDADAQWKFILLTDMLDQGWDHASELPGVSICLKKPVNAERLRLAIDWLLLPREGASCPVLGSSRREPEPVSYDARILVVDDHAANLTVARGMLTRLGCVAAQVVGARDGREAVERFVGQDFDLVLMDCQMPGMDGFEASRIIRKWEQDRQLPPVPILAFTANVSSVTRQRGEAAGMNEFLSKPVTLAELRSVLERYLLPVKRVEGVRPQPVEHGSSSLAASVKKPDAAPVEVEKGNLEILMAAMESIGLPEEDFRDVAGLLVTQIPELIESLERDLVVGDHEAARATAHVLKGSMANTIFPQLQPHTRQLHESIKTRDWESAEAAMAQVRAQFEPVRKALTVFLNEGVPELA